MTLLDERFIQLKADMEVLKGNLEDTTKNVLHQKEKYDLAAKFGNSEKNDPLLHDTIGEFTTASLQNLRASNDIVQKISEKTSNEFEDKINMLETVLTGILESIRNNSKKYYEIENKLKSNAKNMDFDMLGKELEVGKQNVKKTWDELIKVENEMGILTSKLEMMLDGIDSLINYLDGKRE